MCRVMHDETADTHRARQQHGSATLHRRAAFIAAAALLVTASGQSGSSDQALYAAFVDVYRHLCRCGFRPSAVLSLAQLLAASVSARLPPELIEHAMAVCVGIHSDAHDASDGTANETTLAERRRRNEWMERLLLNLRDVASVDANSLVAVCRCAHSTPHSILAFKQAMRRASRRCLLSS